MKEGECESCCPELSGAAAGRGPTPASAYGGARLRTHPFTVGTRILLTITLAVTAVAENLLPTPHEWCVGPRARRAAAHHHPSRRTVEPS